MSRAEILSEVSRKRAELGGAAATGDVLAALMRDAATAWNEIVLLAPVSGPLYPYRAVPHRFARPEAMEATFEKLVAGIERPETVDVNVAALVESFGSRRCRLPGPAMARRLRVVTQELPPLICPVGRQGVASRPDQLWNLLWGDACGITASRIGESFGVNRDRIWKVRRKVYDQLAATIDSCEELRHAA